MFYCNSFQSKTKAFYELCNHIEFQKTDQLHLLYASLIPVLPVSCPVGAVQYVIQPSKNESGCSKAFATPPFAVFFKVRFF